MSSINISTKRLRLISITLIAALMCSLTPTTSATQFEDPTTSTWTIPERVSDSEIEGINAPQQPSITTFQNQLLLAIENGNSISIFMMEGNNFQQLSGLSLNTEQHTNPQLLAYHEMLYLLSLSTFEENWELKVHRTTTIDGWIDTELVAFGDGQPPAAPTFAITSDGKWHVAWTETDHKGPYIVHTIRDNGEWTPPKTLANLTHNEFIQHRDASFIAYEDELHATWVSNMFDEYSFTVEREERQLVHAIFRDGSWTEPQPNWQSFTIDRHPSFVQGTSKPTVIFSTNRIFDKQFESELDNFYDIWIQVLNTGSQPHELPDWPINEGHPTATIHENRLIAFWTDSNGLLWSQTSLTDDTLDQAELSTKITVTPDHFDIELHEENSVGDVSIRNDGQSTIHGKITPSSQLTTSIDTFELSSGEEVRFWVNFNQDIGGKWHEQILITHQGGTSTVPVFITRESLDKSETTPMPPPANFLQETNEENSDMGTIIFITAILIPLLVGGILHTSNGGNPLALRMGLMVSIMLASPFGAMIAEGSNNTPEVKIALYNVDFAYEPTVDIDWYNSSANKSDLVLSEGKPISSTTYEVDAVRTILHTSHAVRALQFNMTHGGTQDVKLRVKDLSTDSIQWHQLVDGNDMRTIQYTYLETIHFNSENTLLDNPLGGKFELILISHRAPGGDALPNSRIKYPVRETDYTAQVNASNTIINDQVKNGNFSDEQLNDPHPWKNTPLSLLNIGNSKVIYDIETNKLTVFEGENNQRELGEKDWQVGMEDGTLTQLEMTVSIVAPLIRSVSIAGPSGSKTQRFFADTDEITIEITLLNEVLRDHLALTHASVTGRIEVRAIDISTNTSYGLVHCEQSVTATNTPSKVTATIPIGKNPSTNCNDQTISPALLEDRNYFLVVDYILSDNKSYSRFGADSDGNILAYQIPPTAFTVTFGNVVKSANLLHEAIIQQENDPDRPIYVITASDAKSTLTLDPEEIIDAINSHSNNQDIIIKRVNSTEELQALVERGDQSITVVNLHGDVLPIPMSYIDGINPPTTYLGQWNFDGKGTATSAPDSSLYRNDGVVTGDPEYIPMANVGVSSLSLDGHDDEIKISSSSAIIVHEGGNYCISLRGIEDYRAGDRHACYSSESKAKAHLPRGLFDLQEMQVHLNIRIKQPTGQNDRLIAAYGEEGKESWEIFLDSKGFIHAILDTESGLIELISQEPAPANKWFNIDLSIDEQIELHISGQQHKTATKSQIIYTQGAHNLYVGGGIEHFNNTAMLIDGMFISDRVTEVDGVKAPSTEDKEAANRWIDRIGRWISENDITYISLGNEPMNMVSNDKSLWKGKVMLLEESGFTRMLADYSVPRDGIKGDFEGAIDWTGGIASSDYLGANASWTIGSLEPKGSLDSNQVSETLAGSGTASVVERFMIGSGAIVQTSLDLDNPYTFIEATDFIGQMTTALYSYNPDPIFVIAAMDAEPCVSTPSSCDASEIVDIIRHHGLYHLVNITSTANLHQIINSGISEALILNMHGDHIPVDGSYVIGANPTVFSEGLFDFESNKVASLTIENSLVNSPDSNAVTISLIERSSGREIESFNWDPTIDLNDPLALENNPNLWVPWKGSTTQTGVNLSEKINIHSNHLKATSASYLIEITLQSGEFSPLEIEIVSNNQAAISVKDLSVNPTTIDRTVNRMASVTNSPSWTAETPLGKNAITLRSEESYFDISGYMPRIDDQTIDFWIKIDKLPTGTIDLMSWYGDTESTNPTQFSPHFGEYGIWIQPGSSSTTAQVLLEQNSGDYGEITIGKWHTITLQSDHHSGTHAELYVDRVLTDATALKPTVSDIGSITGAAALRFSGDEAGINLDQIHVGHYQGINQISANDIDLNQAYEDMGFFFGQSKNTVVSDSKDPFGYASIPGSFTSHMSVDAHQHWTIPVCIKNNKASLNSETSDCTGGLIHSLPKTVSNTIPICVATNSTVDKSLLFKNREACDHGMGAWTTDFVFYVRDSGWADGVVNDKSSIQESSICIEQSINNNQPDTLVLVNAPCSSDKMTFFTPSESKLLSGYNRMYPDDLAPLFVANVSNFKKHDIDFSNILTLGEDIASFTYELNPEQNPSTIRSDLDFLKFEGNMPGESNYLVSPTGDDWMYSLANYQTSDKGAIIHTSMFSIRGGMFVHAPSESHDAKAILGLWARLREHRTMHIMSEEPMLDDSIETYAEEATYNGYLMITNPQPSAGLLDAIDGVYMHGANHKIIALEDPTKLPVPKSWMEGVDTGVGTRVEVSSDVTYTEHNTPVAGLQFSSHQLTTCNTNSTIEIEFSLPQSKYELEGAFTGPIQSLSNLDGTVDISADLFYEHNQTCASTSLTSPNWAAAPLISDLGNTGLNDASKVGQIHTLNIPLPANTDVKQWYIAIGAKMSHTPYQIDIHSVKQKIGGTTTDITDAVLNEQIYQAFDNNHTGDSSVFTGYTERPNDYLQGFSESSIEFSPLHHGFEPTEAVTKFGRWVAHHSHALVIVQSPDNEDQAFSKLLESEVTGSWNEIDIGIDGWDTFASDQLGGMRRNLTSSEGQWETASAFSAELVTKTPPVENRTYWTLDGANQHTHPLLWASNEISQNQDPVRALAMISNGMFLNIGDGDWQSAMDLAVKFAFHTSAIRHMSHVYAKGETVVLEIVVDTSMASNVLHGKFIMEVQAHGTQAESFSVADSLTMSIQPNSLETIYLSWTIESTQHIGGYDIGLAVIDTVLNRYITDYGTQSGEKMSLEVQSLVYITKVSSPAATGAFDRVEVEIHLYNAMSVSNLVDLKAIFTHEDSGHIHWTNDVTINCNSKRRCRGTVAWNPLAQKYDGEVTELGEYRGRVILQDHISRYQIGSVDDDGGAVYQQSNAIIDVSDLLLTLESELQIITPTKGGDWLIRYSLGGPWTRLEAGSILREKYEGRELQLKKLGNESTNDSIMPLSITWLATSDSPSYMMYSSRTSNNERTEYTQSNDWEIKHHVTKFHRDGREYNITTNGMLENSIITIADSPDINMGTISSSLTSMVANKTLFDGKNRNVSFNAKGDGKSVYSKGYTTVLQIDIPGFYQFAGLANGQKADRNNLSNDGIYVGVFNFSTWNPSIVDSYSIDIDPDPSKVSFFGRATGNTSNYFLDKGNWTLFIGNTNVSSDGGTPPTTAPSMPILEDVHFRRGNRVDLPPTPACPGAGYGDSAKEEGLNRTRAQGGDCNQQTEGSGGAQKSRSAGNVGLIHQLVPSFILNHITSSVKIPLIGANSNGGKSNFSHNFGKFGVAKATLGFDDAPFESDFRLMIEFGGELEIEGTGIEVDFSMEADVIMQEQFFRKNCKKDVIIWDCAIPDDIGDYIGWYIRFDVSLEIPISEYVWGPPIDIKVKKSSKSGSVYYTLKLDLYLDVMVGVGLFNNVYACDPTSNFEEEYPALYSSVLCNSDGTSPHPQWVNLNLELTFGARLVFKFYMEFEFKKIHDKLKNIREKMDKANEYAENARHKLIKKIQDYETKATEYIDEKMNDTKNKLTRSQLMAKFEKLSGKHWTAVQAMATQAEEKFKDASHSKKISGEAERWLMALGPAAKANSFIPHGYVSVDFAIGIYMHFDLECADMGHGKPCKVLLSLEIFLTFEVTAHVELFRICVWLLGCWTPTIDVGLELNLDKVIYINIFGGPKGWVPTDFPVYGKVMFNDRSTGFTCFKKTSKDVTAMATNWQPGEGLDAKSGSLIKINALGFIHINFGIPSFGC